MRLRLLPVILCLSVALSAATDYKKVFGSRYSWAQNYLKKHSKELRQQAGEFKIPYRQLESIVFPELVRFSAVSNYLETSAVKLTYINRGSNFADFSIGEFQMKPSFIEKLENWVSLSDKLKGMAVKLRYPESLSVIDQRKERMSRINKPEWQIRYLCAFYLVTKARFPTLSKLGTDRQVRFYAAAYNSGFWLPEEDIWFISTQSEYPSLSLTTARNYSYSDISVFYYKH